MPFKKGNKLQLKKHTPETINKMRRSKVWLKIDEAKKLYESGKTCKEISVSLDINVNTLMKSLKKIGVMMRKPQRRKCAIAWNKGIKYTAIRGNKNPNWKGGISGIRNQIRCCLEYKQWRKDIFERDNYTCQDCGQKGGNLEVHHSNKTFSDILITNKIKSLKDALLCEEFWNLDNGKTLCLKCHNKTKCLK